MEERRREIERAEMERRESILMKNKVYRGNILCQQHTYMEKTLVAAASKIFLAAAR